VSVTVTHRLNRFCGTNQPESNRERAGPRIKRGRPVPLSGVGYLFI
jgi:hypothetical protein